ncbi:MAG: ABC transporter permease subunit [Deltaproteobacteria bacterium]|nr:ABC transporter permease subunit [Deltaproteobacteria bacterium]
MSVRWGLAGWAITAGVALWVGALVALPLAAVGAEALHRGPGPALAAVLHPDALRALALSASLATWVAAVNTVGGLAVAWALVRWDFPGRRLLAAAVDLPFAVPTLVVGVLFVALLGPNTTLGRALEAAGLRVVYAWPGMAVALCFVTLPFVVRAVEPVLAELDPAEQEAARTLGATRWQVWSRVVIPPLIPPLVAGGGQSLARALGEFGAMAVVSGNVPRETLVASVYVLGEVEAGQVGDAAAVSLVLLALAAAAQLAGRRAGRWLGAA